LGLRRAALRGVHRVPSYALQRPASRRAPGGAWPFLLGATLVALVLLGGAQWLYRVSEGDPAWWLLNETPPAVAAAAPSEARRGLLTVAATVEPAGRADLVHATLDGTPLPLPPAGSDPAVTRLEIDTTTVPDGRHVLRLEAVDRSARRLRGAHEVVFTSDNTAPRLELTPSAGRLRAGVPVVVRWGSDEPAEVTLSGKEGAVPALPAVPASAGGRAGAGEQTSVGAAVFAVPVDTPAGEVPLRLAGVDGAGNRAEQATLLPLEGATLPRQALQVPPLLAPLATGPVARDESSQVEALTSAVTPQRRWSGAFRWPLGTTSSRTTGFGDRRDYADGHVVHHAGYDLAAPAGAVAGAAGAGVVVFSGALPQRGNTVILDHGWGIYTLYGHLLAVDVQPGQEIGAGGAVGRVGSSGLSTGPHLHWEVRLRGLPVDPDSWLALSEELSR
jgi:murein DD-endopeptidase MepM/ murein hydrolase activator NlpD